LITIKDAVPAAGDNSFISFEGEQMSSGEELYLLMVVVALALFGGTLAAVSVFERRWAKANGRT
jgi:hypothetical protein